MIFTADTTSAVRWWKNGDHPLDNSVEEEGTLTPGEFVQPYDPPPGMAAMLHTDCGSPWGIHGEIEGVGTVCPGNWVVEGLDGTHRVVAHGYPEVEVGVENADDHDGKWTCRNCDAASVEEDIDAATFPAAIHATEESHVVDVYGIAKV